MSKVPHPKRCKMVLQAAPKGPFMRYEDASIYIKERLKGLRALEREVAMLQTKSALLQSRVESLTNLCAAADAAAAEAVRETEDLRKKLEER